MKIYKLWSEMSEEEWKKERARVKKIQDNHFRGNKSEEGEEKKWR